jgi:glutamate-1-semialdehyde 2,1-aminomutase
MKPPMCSSASTGGVTITTIKRSIIKELLAKEQRQFVSEHPKSKALYKRAEPVLLRGVPMNWMALWAGDFPIFAKEGKGDRIIDVDGHEYVDFCLGDTGSMFGHSPKVVVDAVTKQVRKGITMMLPTEDSIWVGEELKRRFKLPQWQIVMTATDANRFSIRLAREATRRTKILCINGCYHGSVDETIATLDDSGRVIPRSGNKGAPVHPSLTTKVIEFNDVPAMEKALKPRDVACFMLEPAMTNHGLILPDEGYLDAARRLTRKYGTFLLIDETHTLSCGTGGYTKAYGLDPDIITMGKPLASGIPVAAYGISREVLDGVIDSLQFDDDEMGIGGTLSGNALAVAAMKATLQKVYTEESFRKMMPLAKRFYQGIDDEIKSHKLPWCVTRLGIRIEYMFMPERPRNGSQVDAMEDPDLDQLMHLMALNRGVLLTPFHMMALISPVTTKRDVDLHTEVFRECVEEIIS